MPKAKTAASLPGLIDSNMEDDIQMMPTPDSNKENALPSKKNRGRPKTTAAKDSTAKVRKTNPSKAKTATKKTKTQRVPLNEEINGELGIDPEKGDVDSLQEKADDEIDVEPAATREEDAEMIISQDEKVPGRRKPAEKSKQAAEEDVKKVSKEQVEGTEKDGEFKNTPTTTRQRRGPAKGPPVTKKPTVAQPQISADPPIPEGVIPETQQPEPMELDQSGLPGEEDEDEGTLPQSTYKQSNYARAPSKQRQPPVVRKQTGSASDTERTGNDPAIRRKLDEMTKKFESLELKYKNLREVGIKEAEVNFEKLKKQSEERTQGTLRVSRLVILPINFGTAANELIASLKLELSTQSAQAQEARSLRTQLSSANSNLAATQANNLQLTSSLAEAQNEIKTLQVKLSARAQPVTAETGHAAPMRTPGSALRARVPGRGNAMGKEDAAKAGMAILKEELYSDLTGLILRGVERGEESDVYDCIQTGRNGSMYPSYPHSSLQMNFPPFVFGG